MIDMIALEMEDLIYTEVEATPEHFPDLLLQAENVPFQDGYYKNGPTIVELKPTEFDTQEKQTYKFYIPVSTHAMVESSALFHFFQKSPVEPTAASHCTPLQGSSPEQRVSG